MDTTHKQNKVLLLLKTQHERGLLHWHGDFYRVFRKTCNNFDIQYICNCL